MQSKVRNHLRAADGDSCMPGRKLLGTPGKAGKSPSQNRLGTWGTGWDRTLDPDIGESRKWLLASGRWQFRSLLEQLRSCWQLKEG